MICWFNKEVIPLQVFLHQCAMIGPGHNCEASKLDGSKAAAGHKQTFEIYKLKIAVLNRLRVFLMRAGSFLLCLFVLPVVAFADASNGQFMGYGLGKGYADMSQAAERTTTGNLLIEANSPVKPADINEVILVATPVTRSVGYISAASWFATEGEAREIARRYLELLRAKYPDWSFGRELMDASLRIVEVNFDKVPYNLKLRLERGQHEGRDMWRFSMGLGWQPKSKEWQAWLDKSDAEQSAKNTNQNEQLLKDSDVRGL